MGSTFAEGGCSVRLGGRWPSTGLVPLVSSYYCLLAAAAGERRLAKALRSAMLDIYAIASSLHRLISLPIIVNDVRLEALLPIGCSDVHVDMGRGGMRFEAECGQGRVWVDVECPHCGV